MMKEPPQPPDQQDPQTKVQDLQDRGELSLTLPSLPSSAEVTLRKAEERKAMLHKAEEPLASKRRSSVMLDVRQCGVRSTRPRPEVKNRLETQRRTISPLTPARTLRSDGVGTSWS